MSGRWYTLETFYKSKEWESLLVVLKNERVNDNGEIICEYCGKPITKAYDCIGHHVEQLTEENVNDVAISLNPENVKFLHHKCHNRIHNKLGYTSRKVYVVWGSPLSGKTQWVMESRNPGDLIVDMDSIWQCVSGCERYVKPNRLRTIVFGVRDELLDAVRYRRGKWLNAYVIGGYPLEAERQRLIESLGAESVFINTSFEECMERLERCEDNRNVEEWERYIREWWEKYERIPPR